MKLLLLVAVALPALAKTPPGLTASDWSGIRAEYERHRRAVIPVEGGYQARNIAQAWVTVFDGRGFEVTPEGASWRWGLELRSYGYPGHERHAVRARARVEADRLFYHWDSTVAEWFVNRSDGLEHGFTVASRPEGDGSVLTFRLAARGTLALRVSADGRTVSFANGSGAAVLHYAGLKVMDAGGRDLPARFIREAAGLRLEVEPGDAQYPLTIDPIAQQAYLKPPVGGTMAWGYGFGHAVAVSGDTVVVGAPYEGSTSTGVDSTPNRLTAAAGAAYVFTRSSGGWSQQAYLKPAAVGTTQQGDYFGYSVAISGDTAVVGARYESSASTGVNSTPNEFARNAGAAYVFTRSNGVWSQQAYLKPAAVGTTQAGDAFGHSVAVSGDTVVVGAPYEDSDTMGVNSAPNDLAYDSGAAYVFTRSGGAWSQQAYLKPAAYGLRAQGDDFGHSVAVSGDTVVVGAPHESSSTTGVNSSPNESAPGSGAAYVFTRSGGAWSQQAYLKPAAVGTSQVGDFFGYSVAVSGDTVIVGAPYERSSSTGVNSAPDELALQAGAAYVFKRCVGAWIQQAYLKPAAVGTSQAGDTFGYSVAVSGDTAVVGAPRESSGTTGMNSAPDESSLWAGAAYVFTRSGAVWGQQAYVKPAAVGPTQETDFFGQAVAVSGDTAIVGAPQEDSSTAGVNTTPNELGPSSGAAYVGAVPGGVCTYSLSRTMASLDPTGDIARTDVLTGSGCEWSAATDAPWITFPNGAPGRGPGPLRFQAAPNTGAAPRTAYIFAACQTLTVIQAGAPCGLGVTPPSGSLPAMNAAGTLVGEAPASCVWAPAPAPAWLAAPTGERAGTAAISYSAPDHGGPLARTGSIMAGGYCHQVLQAPSNPAQAFQDVPLTHPYFHHIALLRSNNITSGCTTTTYCPDAPVTRGQMAVFLVRALMGGDAFSFPAVAAFTDVPAGHPYFTFIQRMKDLGITSGCTAAAYCPDAPVTRGQMAIFLIRARLGLLAGQASPGPAAPFFGDVAPAHPYFAFIQKLRQLGVTTGCSAAAYCPDEPVTRGQMAVFVIRALFTP